MLGRFRRDLGPKTEANVSVSRMWGRACLAWRRRSGGRGRRGRGEGGRGHGGRGGRRRRGRGEIGRKRSRRKRKRKEEEGEGGRRRRRGGGRGRGGGGRGRVERGKRRKGRKEEEGRRKKMRMKGKEEYYQLAKTTSGFGQVSLFHIKSNVRSSLSGPYFFLKQHDGQSGLHDHLNYFGRITLCHVLPSQMSY